MNLFGLILLYQNSEGCWHCTPVKGAQQSDRKSQACFFAKRGIIIYYVAERQQILQAKWEKSKLQRVKSYLKKQHELLPG